MNSKFFYILGVFAIALLSVSTFLLVRKNVSSFDILGADSDSCVPYNLFVRRGVQDYTVEIVWSTQGKCFGFIQYGTESNDLGMIGVDVENSGKAKEHRVLLEKILTSEKYFFLINSGEKTFGSNGIPLEFTLSNL